LRDEKRLALALNVGFVGIFMRLIGRPWRTPLRGKNTNTNTQRGGAPPPRVRLCDLAAGCVFKVEKADWSTQLEPTEFN